MKPMPQLATHVHGGDSILIQPRPSAILAHVGVLPVNQVNQLVYLVLQVVIHRI